MFFIWTFLFEICRDLFVVNADLSQSIYNTPIMQLIIYTLGLISLLDILCVNVEVCLAVCAFTTAFLVQVSVTGLCHDLWLCCFSYFGARNCEMVQCTQWLWLHQQVCGTDSRPLLVKTTFVHITPFYLYKFHYDFFSRFVEMTPRRMYLSIR